MASKPLFQALLLATSLGWNGVFGYEGSSNKSITSSAEQTLFAPQLGVTRTSLVVPTPVTTSTSSSSYSQPPIAFTPVIGHTELSLDVPTGAPSNSEEPTVAPYPATGHTELSLVVPATTTSRRSRTFKSPQTEQSQTSLVVPGGEGGHNGAQSTSAAPPILYSPATGHSQTSLQLPPTATSIIAPIVATAKSQTKLIVPTRRPTNGNVPTIPLPPEHGHGGGPPTREPAHSDEDGQSGQRQNPWEVVASIAHEQGQEMHNEESGSGPQPTPAPSREGGSTYHFLGTQIVEGASAATIAGTTYSLARSGKGIYVNGQMTTFSGPAATDSVAMAVMSALGGDEDDGKVAQTTSSARSSTLVTATSTEAGGSESSAGAAQQTDNGAAALVLPGVGLGGVGLVMALL